MTTFATHSFTRSSAVTAQRKGPLVRACFAGILAAGAVALGISVEDLATTNRASVSAASSTPTVSRSGTARADLLSETRSSLRP